jgi:hypothetical protein
MPDLRTERDPLTDPRRSTTSITTARVRAGHADTKTIGTRYGVSANAQPDDRDQTLCHSAARGRQLIPEPGALDYVYDMLGLDNV